jgi:hypothetical protein
MARQKKQADSAVEAAAHKVFQGRLARLVDAFEEIENKVRVAVDDSDTYILVRMMLARNRR